MSETRLAGYAWHVNAIKELLRPQPRSYSEEFEKLPESLQPQSAFSP